MGNKGAGGSPYFGQNLNKDRFTGLQSGNLGKMSEGEGGGLFKSMGGGLLGSISAGLQKQNEPQPIPMPEMRGIIPREQPQYQMPMPLSRFSLERFAEDQERGGMFRGFMARGGRLKKPGDWAIAGEAGPEIVMQEQNGTHVIPLNDGNDPPLNIQTLGGFEEGPVTYPTPSQAVPLPQGGPSSAVTLGGDRPTDSLEQQINTLGLIADQAKGNRLFRDPSRYTGIAPTGLGEGPPNQVPEMNGTSSSPYPTDQSEPPPKVDYLRNAINQTYNPTPKANREKSLWKRFGQGVGNAAQQWREDGAPGGIGGLLGYVLGQGTASAVSPGYHDEVKRTDTRRGLFKKFSARSAFEEQDNKQEKAAYDIANTENQISNRNAQTMLQASRIELQQRKDAAEGKQWTQSIRNGKYYKHYKDGREEPILDEKGKQEVEAPKAITIDDKDLPDDLVGLRGDKDIERLADAAVSEKLKDVTYRPEVVAALPASVKNPDGSFNLTKFSELKGQDNESVAGLNLSDIMATAPSDYKQRHAQQAQRLRDEQKELRGEWAKFKTAIKNNRSAGDAVQTSITEVVDLFKEVMALPAKQRTAAFQKLYANLPKMKL